jgi:hypothetical protein
MIATKSTGKTPAQIRYQRTRVALADVLVGMVVKHRHRWFEVVAVPEVDPAEPTAMRPAILRAVGGADAGTEFDSTLCYLHYEVKPCATILRAGDVVMLDRRRVTVTQVRRMMTVGGHLTAYVEVSGFYHLGDRIRPYGITRRLYPITQVRVVEWADR